MIAAQKKRNISFGGDFVTLEGKPQVDEEWMVQGGEDFHLAQNVFQRVSQPALRFAHVLHRVQLPRITLPHYAHLNTQDLIKVKHFII